MLITIIDLSFYIQLINNKFLFKLKDERMHENDLLKYLL